MTNTVKRQCVVHEKWYASEVIMKAVKLSDLLDLYMVKIQGKRIRVMVPLSFDIIF